MNLLAKLGLAIVSLGLGSLVACASPDDATMKTDSDLTSPGATRHCGGFAGFQCGADEFGDYEVGDMCGAADAMGTCRTRPQACARIFRPVCGCDGKTYGNACNANSAGVGVFADGACAPEPVICTAEYDPVCGSDGKTYSNACQAGAAGVDVASKGECAPKPTEKSCGGWLGDTCSDKEYCAYIPGQWCGGADASSVCRPRPEACTADFNPVCGCDRQTYSNACAAAAAGTGVFKNGACN